MSKLMRCPFCGSDDIVIESPVEKDLFHAYCECCFTLGPLAMSDDQAVEEWNKRYHPTCETCIEWTPTTPNGNGECRIHRIMCADNFYCMIHKEKE